MSPTPGDPRALLAGGLESGRVHSAYLLSGPGTEPADAARDFVRALACRGPSTWACEECPDCRRSSEREPVAIDGSGRRGPLLRHVGDHPDLLWVERGEDDTRVRIGQIRALQSALRFRSNEGGWRAAVVANAELLNHEAQNALLRLLEEPPPRTAIVLVTSAAAGLLATLRSRCQRLAFRPREVSALDDPENRELCERLDGLSSAGVPDLLDWAAEYRGGRARAAEDVSRLLEVSSEWVRRRVSHAVGEEARDPRRELGAFRTLQGCRRSLVQRNANPQMVAERALLALREAALG